MNLNDQFWILALMISLLGIRQLYCRQGVLQSMLMLLNASRHCYRRPFIIVAFILAEHLSLIESYTTDSNAMQNATQKISPQQTVSTTRSCHGN